MDRVNAHGLQSEPLLVRMARPTGCGWIKRSGPDGASHEILSDVIARGFLCMKSGNLFVFSAVLLPLLGAAGCATTQDMLQSTAQSYQCEREAANRPDQAQRRAECQLRQQQIAGRELSHAP